MNDARHRQIYLKKEFLLLYKHTHKKKNIDQTNFTNNTIKKQATADKTRTSNNNLHIKQHSQTNDEPD